MILRNNSIEVKIAGGVEAIRFNGLNYAEWYEYVNFHAGIYGLREALVNDKPLELTEGSSQADKDYYAAWDDANSTLLSFMKMTMDSTIWPSMPTTNVAKEFVQQLKECASTEGASKAMASTLMAELTTKKFDWSKSMHDHITNMVNLSAKLKNLKVEVSEEWMVEMIINSLPTDFGSFVVSYNNLKKKWTLLELKAKVIQEEARLKKEGKTHIAHVTVHSSQATSSKIKPNKKKKGHLKAIQGSIQKVQKCFFYNKVGHVKKDCLKRKVWFEKREIQYDPAHNKK